MQGNNSRNQPDIKTERLLLRPFGLQDAETVFKLAGDRRIADVTANIPHPYPRELADEWIQTHADAWYRGESAVFAVTTQQTRLLTGCISLSNIENHEAELGYWIGVDYWNQGYCSESVPAMLSFGFKQLQLNRIYARHLSRNPASGRVMAKAGMLHTGTGTSTCGFRQQNEDTEYYEILRQPD